MENRAPGRKNIVFGIAYLIFTVAMGLYLAKKTGSGEIAMGSAGRDMIINALLYANLDAILNIIAGVALNRLPFVDWLSRAVSLLLIAGALMHSGMLYLSGFSIMPSVLILIPLGAILLSGIMLFVGIGVIGLRTIKAAK